MSRSLALVSGLLLVSGQAASGQIASNRGAFIIRSGVDTLVIEQFAWSGDTLRGVIDVKGQPHQQYVALLGPGSAIRTLAVRLMGDDSAAPPLQRVTVTMRNDSAVAEINGAAHAFATSHGAVPLLNNSFAIAELLARRARAAGGSADIPVWAVTGGMTLTVNMRPIGADSMTLSIGSTVERLRVDQAGHVLGGEIPSQHIGISRIGAAAAALLRSRPKPPAAVLPAGLVERAIVVPGPVPLPGTLTIPSGRGPFRGVILVHGSGAGDRDETMPAPLAPSKPFEDLAWGLAQQGIVVLRYDKRARVNPGSMVGKNLTVFDETIQDALSALTLLRHQPEVDLRETFAIGHSLGAMLAPRIAKMDGKVAGIVMMAGATRVRLIDQMTRQYAYFETIAGADSTNAKAASASLAPIAARVHALKPSDSSDNTPIPGLGGTGTRYWLDMAQYDPALTMRDVHIPALVLQGMRDYQVPPDQLDGWLAAVGARSDITVKRYPSLNHLFMFGSGQPGPADYRKLEHVDPQVISDIATWVKAQ